MNLTKQQFQQDFTQQFQRLYPIALEDGTSKQWFYALGKLIQIYNQKRWVETKEKHAQQKQVFYFSMEFLPGRFLKNHLYNMGISDIVREGLHDLNISLDEVVEAEPEPGLGNGGLGRLAACFMDSGASLDLPLHGIGLRYEYGLFKQKFLNNYQIELPDSWIENGSPWEYRNEKNAVTVRFGGRVWLNESTNQPEVVYENTTDVLAVPYDWQVIGWNNDTVNTLRLWKAEIPVDNESDYPNHESRQEVAKLSGTLYPDDSTEEGRILRLRQEYFLVSAGVQSVVNDYISRGLPIESFADYIGFHINDTHPALVIPELMRILVDEFRLDWQEAKRITVATCSFTNHTIMQEALEKWPVDMIGRLLPRIYQIIEEIHYNTQSEIIKTHGHELAKKIAIINETDVHMANLAIVGSHSINGVASLHTEILKSNVLKDFYEVYPDRFINQTNGITHRRWIHVTNSDLTDLISKRIGDGWKKDPEKIIKLKQFADDEQTLHELAKVKRLDKEYLAHYIVKETGIQISTEALFDVLIKRLHAYKRQDMQLLHMIARYLYIKENPQKQIQPRVFIFGAKAASNYTYAKQVIKIINELADLVNKDTEIGDKMKIIFLENYRVSIAEKIIPAADLSEQISLAGKEASGTGNMKFMSNGALLMGTRDGANIEILEKVGEENAFVFGLDANEVKKIKTDNSYHSIEFYENNPKIKKILDTLIDGTIPHIQTEGQAVFNELVKHGDEYFTMLDLQSFIEAQKKADQLYALKNEWYRKSLLNIASSGSFSSDYTIKRYAEEIWDITPIR